MFIPLMSFTIGLLLGLSVKALHLYKKADARGAVEKRRRMTAEHEAAQARQEAIRYRGLAERLGHELELRRLLDEDGDGIGETSP